MYYSPTSKPLVNNYISDISHVKLCAKSASLSVIAFERQPQNFDSWSNFTKHALCM